MNTHRFVQLMVLFCLAAALMGCLAVGAPASSTTQPVETEAQTAAASAIPAALPIETTTAAPTGTASFPLTGATGNPREAEYLVLISVDAMRPDYLELAEMPNLQALIQNGAYYTGAWVGALESNTPPGHTEISTGCFPKHNGIMGFNWGSESLGERFNPTSLEAIQNGDMAQIVEQSGVPTLAGLVKAKYPDGKVIALSSHKYYAAQGLGMGPTDFILYSEKIKGDKAKATPEGGLEGYEAPRNETLKPAALEGHSPGEAFLDDPELVGTISLPGDDNVYVLRVAEALFREYQPRALLINLPETDSWGHKTGGISTPETISQVLETTDRGLGELMALYRAAGIYDKTLWVVTADHGMTPALTTYPLEDVAGVLNLQRRVNRVNVPKIYLADPEQAQALANKLAESKLEGITGVYARLETKGEYSYQPAEATAASLPADLNAAYQYLLSSFAGPYSPDIVITTPENVLFEKGNKERQGAHGEVNWADQHIPLIISGPGVQPGSRSEFPARLVDILPTISRLMGLKMDGFDGIVLSDGLRTPLESEMAAQAEMAAYLTPLRDALRLSAGK